MLMTVEGAEFIDIPRVTLVSIVTLKTTKERICIRTFSRYFSLFGN
jgi:hypothetical protein